jgi:hypothetical protein
VHLAGLGVQLGVALAVDEVEKLVDLVRLLADVVAGLHAHQHDLAVLVRQDDAPEVGVVLRLFGDVLVDGGHGSLSRL